LTTSDGAMVAMNGSKCCSFFHTSTNLTHIVPHLELYQKMHCY
jgi:hypothetical protein